MTHSKRSQVLGTLQVGRLINEGGAAGGAEEPTHKNVTNQTRASALSSQVIPTQSGPTP